MMSVYAALYAALVKHELCACYFATRLWMFHAPFATLTLWLAPVSSLA